MHGCMSRAGSHPSSFLIAMYHEDEMEMLWTNGGSEDKNRSSAFASNRKAWTSDVILPKRITKIPAFTFSNTTLLTTTTRYYESR